MNDAARASAYSKDPNLANAVTLGNYLNGAPCSLDMGLLTKGHGHILGATMSGKSVCGRNAITQILMRQTAHYKAFAEKTGIEWKPMSFVFLTFVKGDDDRERNYFATLAHKAGLKFLSLEPTTGEWTHSYTPQAQEFYGKLSPLERAIHTLECLELGGSEEDVTKYFGGKDTVFTIAAEDLGGPFSNYADHYKFVASKANREQMGFNQRASDHADQVNDHLRIMGAIEAINRPTTSIDLGKIFHERTFVYVNLDGLGNKLAHMLGKQILFDVKRAAQVYRKTRKNHVFFFGDEADILVQSSGVVGLLNRIRHRGVSIVLAHQYAEQTGDFGVGLDVNSGWSIDFGLATAEAVEKMQAHAPEDLQYLLNRAVNTRDIDREEVAEAVRLAVAEATATERYVPRFSKNKAIELNRTGHVGWLRVKHDIGATRVDGVAPFYWTHALSKAEWNSYKDRSEHVPFHEMFKVELPTPEEPRTLRDRQTDDEAQQSLDQKLEDGDES